MTYECTLVSISLPGGKENVPLLNTFYELKSIIFMQSLELVLVLLKAHVSSSYLFSQVHTF